SDASLSAQGGEALTATKILRVLSRGWDATVRGAWQRLGPDKHGLSGTILQPTATPSLHGRPRTTAGAFHAPRVTRTGHGPIRPTRGVSARPPTAGALLALLSDRRVVFSLCTLPAPSTDKWDPLDHAGLTDDLADVALVERVQVKLALRRDTKL